MKKILLFMFLMSMTVPVKAVDWQYIQTDIPDLYLFIDIDSIKILNSNEYIYAIRYQNGSNEERAVYIKSDSQNNRVGIIRAEDYNYESYAPNKVFTNTHAFMKPIQENSFLSYADNYAHYALNNDIASESNIVPVSYTKNTEYTASIAAELEKNWTPPKSGQYTFTTVVLTIGRDGSLLNYKFAESSGDEATDRSIISAIEKTAPFGKLPGSTINTAPVNLQFIFDYARFKKSVK